MILQPEHNGEAMYIDLSDEELKDLNVDDLNSFNLKVFNLIAQKERDIEQLFLLYKLAYNIQRALIKKNI